MTKKYFFSVNDVDNESLKNRLFTIDQLKTVYHRYFENEIRECNDNETTFESWLNDNIEMSLIYEVEISDTLQILKKYKHEYISCLPMHIENQIIATVINEYSDSTDLTDMIDNIICEKVANITDTINIKFI